LLGTRDGLEPTSVLFGKTVARVTRVTGFPDPLPCAVAPRLNNLCADGSDPLPRRSSISKRSTKVNNFDLLVAEGHDYDPDEKLLGSLGKELEGVLGFEKLSPPLT
jgi:hypothetical protein